MTQKIFLTILIVAMIAAGTWLGFRLEHMRAEHITNAMEKNENI